MKLNTSALTAVTKRQYWHKDAKWICAILLVIFIGISLPFVSLYRLTAKAPATKALSYTLAGLTSPDGIDSTSGIDDLRQKAAATGSTQVYIGGVPVTFTTQDFSSLSPRELRLKVFGSFASEFYNKGAAGLVKSQGLNDDAAQQFQKNSSTIALFTRSAHQHLGKIVSALTAIDLMLLAAVVMFSYRFGRLASPGLALMIASFLALPLAALAASHQTVTGTARPESATSNVSAVGNFISFVAPLVLPYFSGTYMFTFLSGVLLLAAAGVGLFIYKLTHKSQPKPPETKA